MDTVEPQPDLPEKVDRVMEETNPGKVVASYQARITLRDDEEALVPTVVRVEEAIMGLEIFEPYGVRVNVERLDK